MKELLVERPGVFTLVIDRGRLGHRDLGVAWCGPMDRHAYDLGNAMLGNNEDAAALEITLGNATFRFDSRTEFALTGAPCEARLNDAIIENGAVVEAGPSAHLTLKMPPRGVRTYLSIAGGIDVPVVMDSRTTDVVAKFGGHLGRPLATGDRLRIGEPGFGGRRALAPLKPTGQIRLMPAGEFDHFAPESQAQLFSVPWSILPESSRMGYRLNGPTLTYSGLELHSHAVFPGIVQVPPNGSPIVLMADAQTTGGYPKIGVVAPEDLSVLAQMRPGESFSFVHWKA